MQQDGVKHFIDSVGALAEAEALHFKQLIKQGLSRKDALTLTQTYLICTLIKPVQSEQEKPK